jgi:hypothetical protein
MCGLVENKKKNIKSKTTNSTKSKQNTKKKKTVYSTKKTVKNPKTKAIRKNTKANTVSNKQKNNIPIASKFIIAFFALSFLFAILFLIFSNKSEITNPGGVQYAEQNYGKIVQKYAKKYNLPYSYLMALIMLESSGRKNIKPRFERHVYRKLKLLKQGRIKRFEDLTPEDVKNFSDKKLRELSKSYGPFQIMGYKTVKWGISIKDLQGYRGVKYGIRWIDHQYGKILRQGRFKDAFHIHNTGQKYPRNGQPQTHSPSYVSRGMKYLRYFSHNH